MIFMVSDTRTMSGQSGVIVMCWGNTRCLFKSTNSCQSQAALKSHDSVLSGFSPGLTGDCRHNGAKVSFGPDGTTYGVWDGLQHLVVLPAILPFHQLLTMCLSFHRPWQSGNTGVCQAQVIQVERAWKDIKLTGSRTWCSVVLPAKMSVHKICSLLNLLPSTQCTLLPCCASPPYSQLWHHPGQATDVPSHEPSHSMGFGWFPTQLFLCSLFPHGPYDAVLTMPVPHPSLLSTSCQSWQSLLALKL